MKAFIMSAGEGTRLRPLTFSLPKPMMPIVNKPVLEHILELVKKHGIKEVVVNTHWQYEKIKRYFGRWGGSGRGGSGRGESLNGNKFGLKIHFSYEPKLLGTAGGIKKMEKFLCDNTFVVMSGDGLTDINITDVLKFHHEKKSFATIVVKNVDQRFDYGVIQFDKNFKVKKFIEKPKWSDVFSNSVNTGIYVLEPEIFNFIPKDSFFDFGLHLWPLLLKKNKKIYTYLTNDYWCDIGNIKEYHRAHNDALNGKVKIQIPGEQIAPYVWVDSGTKIGKDVKLNSPVVIGKNCIIKESSVIDSFTTIGNKTFVDKSVCIKNSILWGNIKVEKNVHMENCIIDFYAKIKENISVFDGEILELR